MLTINGDSGYPELRPSSSIPVAPLSFYSSNTPMPSKFFQLLHFDMLSRQNPVLLIFFVALILRATCAVLFSGMIDPEGAEYARMAENIRAGIGYVGIAAEGPEVVLPPLFPYFIAGLSFLTGNAEFAGRLLSVMMGSLLVVPVYLIGVRIYDRRVAILAACLVAIHPLLIEFSITVFCESTYLTLILSAIYVAMRTASDLRLTNFAWMGALYGVAYLVRPEALALLLVASVTVCLWHFGNRVSWFPTVCGLILCMAIFSVLSLPYASWLSSEVGSGRVEGKIPLNMATEARIQKGMSVEEAAFGVEPDLTLSGIYIRPYIDTFRSFHPTATEWLHLLAIKAKAVEKAAVENLGDPRTGAPALFATAILGLFVRPWSLRVALDQLHLTMVLSLAIVGTFFIYNANPRFYLLFVPVFCIWGAAGIYQLSQWAQRSAKLSALHPSRRAFSGAAAAALAIASIYLPSASFAMARFVSMRGDRPIKEASERLGSEHPAARMADTSTLVAYHARARFIWLPYCDEDTALRFLAKTGVTHVVVRRQDIDMRPYLKRWSEEGVPNSHLAASVSGVDVYELNP